MSESVKNLKEKLDNLLDDGAHNSLSDNSAVVDHLLEPAAPIVANDAVLPVENDIFNEKSNILELETEKNEVDFKAHRQKTPVTVPAIKITSMEREIQALQLTKRNGLRNSEKDAYILAHSFGFQSHKRSNIHFIDDGIILSSIGNLMVFYNFKTNEQRYVEGIREASIGAIAVHPSGKYIAVGEVCRTQPNIYLYEYPSMDLYKILKGGASRGYADLTFNTSGTKIASVATEPDYTLTVWNWESSSILLRSKAFSQDVFRVRFSADNDGILTTSGMGHIKFWRMATTFTGLKLQGYLGKFGASELSDIASFLQLPDGKVLSTTETGNLLLWDGGMIKCEICVKGGIPCHQGKVEVILLVEDEIITAGEDGYVRVWDLETIDNADVITAEGSGSSVATPRVFEMLPKDQMLISKEVKVSQNT